MRVYISGPITGVPDYRTNFKKAEQSLKDKGYSVVNPAAIADVLPTDMTYEEYMQHDLFLLDMCGAMVMLPGWHTSIGANREYGYALGRDITVLDLKDLVGVEVPLEEVLDGPYVLEEPEVPAEVPAEPKEEPKPGKPKKAAKAKKENKKDIVRDLLEKGLTIRQISEQSGIKYATVWTCVERIRKEDMSVADKAGSGPNADRHLCKICQYRPGASQGDKFGCAYLLITGHSRGCGAAECDKFVKGEPIKMNSDDF